MAGTTTESRNWTYLTVKSVAYGMFATGLALSVTHTYDLFHDTLGAASVSAAAVPVFIDGVQLIGRLARSHQFDEATRRLGKRAQLTGSAISLAANIIAGHAVGDKIAGAIFVLGYILMEAFAERMSPAATKAEQAKAAKSAAAAKAAATRAANKVKAAAEAQRKAEQAAARKAKREQAKAEQAEWDAMVKQVAPISPAPADTRAYL